MKFLPFFLAFTAAQLSCPAIECFDNARPDGLCFEHSGSSPVTKVNFYPCQHPDEICELDSSGRDFPLRSQEMAWVNSTQQKSSIVNKNQESSAIFGKRTQAYCVSR